MLTEIHGLAPAWTFTLEERSACHYIGRGTRTTGQKLSVEGLNEIELAWQAGQYALELNAQIADGADVDGRSYLVTSPLARSLPNELKALLTEEILFGNRIAEEGRGYGQVVLLERRFRIPRQGCSPPLVYRLVDDPHWYEEVWYAGTDFSVAARSRE